MIYPLLGILFCYKEKFLARKILQEKLSQESLLQELQDMLLACVGLC